MRILFISHACVIDLNQNFLVQLASYPDIQLGLIAPKRFRSDILSWMDFKRTSGLEAKVYPLSACLSGITDQNINLHFYPGYLSAISEFKPDILMIDEEPISLSALQFASAAKNAYQVFATKQNILKQYPPPFSIFERYVWRKSSCAVAISETVKHLLRTKGYSKEIFVIQHSVDLESFYPRDVSPLKEKLELKGIVIGYIGRIANEKGIDTLIEAVSLVKREFRDPFSLLLVGDGPQRSHIMKRVGELAINEIVKLIPPVSHSQVPDYLNCLDILVLPSRTMPNWREQFGRILVESVASGVPVIGSDSGEIPNTINSLRGGLVFKEDDREDLKQNLIKFMQYPEEREKLKKAGRERVKRFTHFRIAEDYYRMFQWVMKQG